MIPMCSKPKRAVITRNRPLHFMHPGIFLVVYCLEYNRPKTHCKPNIFWNFLGPLGQHKYSNGPLNSTTRAPVSHRFPFTEVLSNMICADIPAPKRIAAEPAVPFKII